MKKLLLLLMLTCANILYCYVPTPGPLTLVDTPNQLGAIGSSLANNPHLQNEANIINQFSQTLPHQARTYQGIVQALIQSQSPLALQTLQALENTIMYIYYDKAFVVHVPLGTDYSYQGIRYTWLNPISYFNPKSWTSDNDTMLDQLISELYELAKIANNKDPIMGSRMFTKVHLYRHWRKYILGTIVCYLAYDHNSREWEDTFLYHLIEDDNFEDAYKILKNDIHSGLKFTKKQIEFIWKECKKAYHFVFKS